jgi:hypothetical protein
MVPLGELGQPALPVVGIGTTTDCGTSAVQFVTALSRAGRAGQGRIGVQAPAAPKDIATPGEPTRVW